jgi:membrane protein required for colicin V production
MNWVDWVILAVIAMSVVAGLFDGFVKTVLSFVGVLAAFFLSPRLAIPIGDFLDGWMKPQFANIAGFVLAFALVLVVFALLTWLLRKALDKLALSWFDRVLGGGLGFVRAAAILGILAVLADIAGGFSAARGSKMYPLALKSGKALVQLVPEDAKQLLHGRLSGKGGDKKGDGKGETSKDGGVI